MTSIKIGIIGSSGGAALAAAYDCCQKAGKTVDLCVLTDRSCGMLDWAVSAGIPCQMVPYENGVSFSEKALGYFQQQNVDAVLLFYTRRVAEPLISRIPVFNIHPSLLPAFPGLHGVRDAMRSGVRILGCTLHVVDAGLDTGPIVSQVASALPCGCTLERANKISYLQKIYLTLVFFELLGDFGLCKDPSTGVARYAGITTCSKNASPSIQDRNVLDAFESIQSAENCHVIQ